MREMKDFLARHHLEEVSEFMSQFVHQGSDAYRLSFVDFKKLLLNTKLVKLERALEEDDPERDADQYLVHESFFSIVAGAIFDRADADGDGKLGMPELRRPGPCVGLGSSDYGSRACFSRCLHTTRRHLGRSTAPETPVQQQQQSLHPSRRRSCRKRHPAPRHLHQPSALQHRTPLCRWLHLQQLHLRQPHLRQPQT